MCQNNPKDLRLKWVVPILTRTGFLANGIKCSGIKWSTSSFPKRSSNSRSTRSNTLYWTIWSPRYFSFLWPGFGWVGLVAFQNWTNLWRYSWENPFYILFHPMDSQPILNPPVHSVVSFLSAFKVMTHSLLLIRISHMICIIIWLMWYDSWREKWKSSSLALVSGSMNFSNFLSFTEFKILLTCMTNQTRVCMTNTIWVRFEIWLVNIFWTHLSELLPIQFHSKKIFSAGSKILKFRAWIFNLYRR